MIKKIAQAVLSVLSAMIGVQKRQTLTRDFTYAQTSGPWLFIIVGAVMTVLFVLTIVMIVKLVLA